MTKEVTILDSIKNRRSIYAFDSKPVEKEKLEQLFEAARWAASPYNTQPWRFVYATKENPEEYQKFYDSLMEFNQEWAKTAPVLMVICARKNFEFNEKPDPFHIYATGMAVGNMLTQLTELGLMAHQVGGFEVEKISEKVNIPEGFVPIAMMALGYEGDVTTLSKEIQKRDKIERTRKVINEIAYEGSWKS